MTYNVKLAPATMALLDGYCRAAGRSLRATLGLHLTATLPQPAAPAAEPAQPVLPAPAPLIAEPEPLPEPRPSTPEEDASLLSLLNL